jgi:hypothetical protein
MDSAVDGSFKRPVGPWLGSYVETAGRTLDQEIAVEADTYRSANLTTFHSICFGLFLLFAGKYVGLVRANPKGWMIHNLTRTELWFQIFSALALLLVFGFIMERAFYLQRLADTHLGRKVRANSPELATDVRSYIAQIPIDMTLILPSQGIDLVHLWLGLRILEQKVQIVSRYRAINRKRKRAYLIVTFGFFAIAALAEIGTTNLSSLYDRYQPNAASEGVHQ